MDYNEVLTSSVIQQSAGIEDADAIKGNKLLLNS